MITPIQKLITNTEEDITNTEIYKPKNFPTQLMALTELKTLISSTNSDEYIINSKTENLEYQSSEIDKEISIKDAVKEKIKFENETKIKEGEEEIKYYDKIIEIVELLLTSGILPF